MSAHCSKPGSFCGGTIGGAMGKRGSTGGANAKAKNQKQNAATAEKFPHVKRITEWLLDTRTRCCFLKFLWLLILEQVSSVRSDPPFLKKRRGQISTSGSQALWCPRVARTATSWTVTRHRWGRNQALESLVCVIITTYTKDFGHVMRYLRNPWCRRRTRWPLHAGSSPLSQGVQGVVFNLEHEFCCALFVGQPTAATWSLAASSCVLGICHSGQISGCQESAIHLTWQRWWSLCWRRGSLSFLVYLQITAVYVSVVYLPKKIDIACWINVLWSLLCC